MTAAAPNENGGSPEKNGHERNDVVKRDIVVVGASAGGVEALRELIGALPADFPAAVLVVLHVPATGGSALPKILDRAGALPVKHAQEGDEMLPGTVLVAPPDRHLLVYDGRVSLSAGPVENGHRPAVDVLFRSAAATNGARVIGVILSGALDDGAAGMVAVKLRGGLGMVQDPDEALYDSMPRAAAAAAAVDHVLGIRDLADTLVKVAGEPAPDDPPASPLMVTEAAMAGLDSEALKASDRPGEPSGLSCPDCNGVLFLIEEGGLPRFRCRVGHAWSPASLVAQQTSAFETALWVALRTLEEKAALTLELAGRARTNGHRLSAEQFDRQSQEAKGAAELVRSLISRMGEGAADTSASQVPFGE